MPANTSCPWYMLVYVIPIPCKTDHNIPRKDIMVRIINSIKLKRVSSLMGNKKTRLLQFHDIKRKKQTGSK